MAKLNGNIYRELNKQEFCGEIMKIMPMLQEMMSKSDYQEMKEDYEKIKNEGIPFWEFVFNHLEVKYCK